MKHTRKIIASLILALMLLSSIMSVGVSAADGTTVYFKPDSNWHSDGARFAVYVWADDSDYKWVDMTDDNSDGIYESTIPSGYTNLIFVRLNPNDSHNGWSTKWNQTVDLSLPTDGKNLFTITTPWNSDDKGEGEWSAFDPTACVHDYRENSTCTKCGNEVFYIIAGNVAKINDEYMQGDNTTFFGTDWDVKNENNRMTYDTEAECFIKVYENVAAGEYHFKVSVDKSWDNGSYGDGDENCYIKVEEDGSTVVITFNNGTVKAAAGVVQSDNNEAPDNSADQGENESPVKLNFFQKIWLAIKNFFANLFGGKK